MSKIPPKFGGALGERFQAAFVIGKFGRDTHVASPVLKIFLSSLAALLW
jgi:hypothetical protein